MARGCPHAGARLVLQPEAAVAHALIAACKQRMARVQQHGGWLGRLVAIAAARGIGGARGSRRRRVASREERQDRIRVEDAQRRARAGMSLKAARGRVAVSQLLACV